MPTIAQLQESGNEVSYYLRLRSDAAADLIKQALKKKFRSDIEDGKLSELPTVLKEAVDRLGAGAFVKEKPDVRKWFITISAKDPVDYHKFYMQMFKCVEKSKLLGSGQWVIEQRSEGDQAPYGWHIHWRVEFAQHHPKSVYVQQIYQCFSKFLAGANYVDMKPWNESQLAYMDGEKKQDKMAKVEKDRILRNKFGFSHKVVY